MTIGAYTLTSHRTEPVPRKKYVMNIQKYTRPTPFLNTVAIKISTLLIVFLCTAIPLQALYAQTKPTANGAKTPTAETTTIAVATQIQTLIDNYRRIISLQGILPNSPQHQEAIRAGQYLFFENQRNATELAKHIIATTRQGDDRQLSELINTLKNTEYRDADLFALRYLITEITNTAVLPAQQSGPLHAMLKSISNAHIKYGDELSKALSQPSLSESKPERPAWASYLREVEQNYPPQSVLDQLRQNNPSQEQQNAPSEKIDALVESTRHNEWQGFQLEKGNVLLTFDDGPHPVYTKQILDILARYHVKAIFFQLGQNLGTVHDGHAELTRNQEVEKELLSAGHAIGNHSFTHPFLPKLDQAQIEQEIDQTQALLNLVIPDDSHRTHMFRAPYGARNSLVLGEIGERGLRSVLWNIDSLDWSDPIPESIVHRILEELEHNGRGIILMHDIHPKTVIALPLLLDQLIKRGYHFVQWDGKTLVPTPMLNVSTAVIESQNSQTTHP